MTIFFKNLGIFGDLKKDSKVDVCDVCFLANRLEGIFLSVRIKQVVFLKLSIVIFGDHIE